MLSIQIFLVLPLMSEFFLKISSPRVVLRDPVTLERYPCLGGVHSITQTAIVQTPVWWFMRNPHRGGKQGPPPPPPQVVFPPPSLAVDWSGESAKIPCEVQGEAAAKPDGWHHAARRYMIGSEAGTGETWDEP